MGRITRRRRILKARIGEDPVRVEDRLAVEEPLEIRVNGTPLAVTMRTPGHDVELAAGLLVAEGVIAGAGDLTSAMHCGGDDAGPNTYNTLAVRLGPSAHAVPASAVRSLATTSACGTCGKESIDALRTQSRFPLEQDHTAVTPDTLVRLPAALRSAQPVFDATGGLHAAALADARTGDLLVVREDVGRHNAVDKVIGWATLDDRLPLTGTILQVSGRVGFELVQKAAMAGIPILSAVSAPSSLAVEAAEELGVTLVGFVRPPTFNVYTHPGRIAFPLG